MKCNLNDYVTDCFQKAAHERYNQFALPTLNRKKIWPITNEEPLLSSPFRKLLRMPNKNRKKPNGKTRKDEKNKRIGSQ